MNVVSHLDLEEIEQLKLAGVLRLLPEGVLRVHSNPRGVVLCCSEHALEDAVRFENMTMIANMAGGLLLSGTCTLSKRYDPPAIALYLRTQLQHLCQKEEPELPIMVCVHTPCRTIMTDFEFTPTIVGQIREMVEGSKHIPTERPITCLVRVAATNTEGVQFYQVDLHAWEYWFRKYQNDNDQAFGYIPQTDSES